MRYAIAFLLLLSTLDSTSVDAVEATEQPNIVFVFADDWGHGDLGCYGNKEVATPHIDKLAAEGTLYTQFHVTSGVCSPSRTSVITGHFPARHRVHGHFAGNEPNARRGMTNWLDETRVWNGNGPTWKGDQLWPTTRYMDDDVLRAQSSSRIAVEKAQWMGQRGSARWRLEAFG